MRFHHMAIFVSDMAEAIHLWRDVMGFKLIVDRIIPDGDVAGPGVYMYAKLLDDIFKVTDARSKMALLVSEEGALIELQQCENPKIKTTPKENLRYGHTGFHELGLVCDDIDAFFEKVQKAGYETQTDYVWTCSDIGRSFLFYDKDGNMIQIWEHTNKSHHAADN